jgi:hypothetical protein
MSENLRVLGHQPMPVLKAIRAKCLDCSGGLQSEVRDCLVRNCALYPFRMGSNPWRAPVSDEHRERAARIAIAVKKRRDGRGNDATDGEPVPNPQNLTVVKNRGNGKGYGLADEVAA